MGMYSREARRSSPSFRSRISIHESRALVVTQPSLWKAMIITSFVVNLTQIAIVFFVIGFYITWRDEISITLTRINIPTLPIVVTPNISAPTAAPIATSVPRVTPILPNRGSDVPATRGSGSPITFEPVIEAVIAIFLIMLLVTLGTVTLYVILIYIKERRDVNKRKLLYHVAKKHRDFLRQIDEDLISVIDSEA